MTDVMELPVHPYAAMWPRHSGIEARRLADSIRKHGLKRPILVYKGMVLDGIGRRAACQAAGVPCQIKIANFKTDAEAFDQTIIENLDHRHIPAEDQIRLAIKFTQLHPDAGAEKLSEQMRLSKTAAAVVATVVKRAEPELINAVEKGEVSLQDARVISLLPAENQREYTNSKVKPPAREAVRKHLADKVDHERTSARQRKKDDSASRRQQQADTAKRARDDEEYTERIPGAGRLDLLAIRVLEKQLPALRYATRLIELMAKSAKDKDRNARQFTPSKLRELKRQARAE